MPKKISYLIMMRIFIREEGQLDVNIKKLENQKCKKDKLPFAVFVCPKSNSNDVEDYKQVFTDIISDRIQEKYR